MAHATTTLKIADTLNEQMEQAGMLMQETGIQPAEAYVDLGYRGVDKENLATGIRHRGKKGSLTTEQTELLSRRQAVEPIIGHLKADHRMGRCYLKGEIGDRLNAVLCAAIYNLRWLIKCKGLFAPAGSARLQRV